MSAEFDTETVECPYCGAANTISKGAKTVKCSRCGRGFAVLRCPYCGATFGAPHMVNAATCPYCGYYFYVKSEKDVGEHYYFKVVFSSGRAFQRMLSFIARNFGAPEDFTSATSLRSATLHYVPIHAVHAEAEGECEYHEGLWFWRKSYTGDFVEVRDIFLPATSKFQYLEDLKGYRFSLRGREYFKPRVVRVGRYYPIESDKDAALRAADATIRKSLMKDLESGCAGRKTVTSVRLEYLGVTHYPLWELKYEYRGTLLTGLVDASSGRVVFAEHPIAWKAKEMASIMSAATIIPPALVGSAVGGALAGGTMAAVGGVAGLIIGLVVAAPALAKVFKKVEKSRESLSDWGLFKERDMLESVSRFLFGSFA